MRKTISFKLFCAVVWKGICQGAKCLAKLFGYQGSDRYMRTVWKITVGCLSSLTLIVTIAVTYCFITEIICDSFFKWIERRTSQEVREERYLSNHIAFQHIGYKRKTRVVNTITQEILLKDIDNVIVSPCGDSLAVFFKGKYRGYLNRFTGEVVVPAKYTKAWVFSEGLAAVEHEGELKFIDHSGYPVISKGFEVSQKDDGYLFHNGYCFIRDKVNGMIGAIDTLGNWAIEPQFTHVMRYGKYIRVQDDLYQGLYTQNLEVVFPMEHEIVHINTYSNTIFVRKGEEAPQLYDMDLNMLQDFVVDEVKHLQYNTGEVEPFTDEDGDCFYRNVTRVANCSVYSVGGYYTRTSYGLISKSGERLTPPLYTKIEAIAPDRYLCHPHGVILNDRGEEI